MDMHAQKQKKISPAGRQPSTANDSFRSQPPFGTLLNDTSDTHSADTLPGFEIDSSVVPRISHHFADVRVHAAAPEAIQTKLTINQPGDVYEQEAERVAERVMQVEAPASSEAPSTSQNARLGADDLFTRKEASDTSVHETASALPLVDEVLSSGGGQPLDESTRSFMEPRFGHDFSRVRVHTDERAAESARAVNALAYTAGQDVVFGGGQYEPGTNEGKKLLAHELTHVVQQNTTFGSGPLVLGSTEDGYELEAEAASSNIGTLRLRENGAHSESLNSSVTASTPPFTVSPLGNGSGQRSLQRKPPKQKLSTPDVLLEEVSVDERWGILELINDIESIVEAEPDIVNAIHFKENWTLIRKQIDQPSTQKPKTGEKKTPEKLYDQKLVDRLRLMNKYKSVIIALVHERMVQYMSAIKILSDPKGKTYEEERDILREKATSKLPESVRKAIPEIDMYIVVRDALISKFSPGSDFEEAKTNMENYYNKELGPANFPSADSKVEGSKGLVHKDMQRQLAKAAKIIKDKGWLPLVEDGIRKGGGIETVTGKHEGIGGVEIRPNVNRGRIKAKKKGIENKEEGAEQVNLSDHTFGWAIDIAASVNPNLKDFPSTLVEGFSKREGFTGDVFTDPAARSLHERGTLDKMLASAKVLKQASEDFEVVFRNENTLKSGLVSFLKRQGAEVTEDEANMMFNLLEKAPPSLLKAAREKIKSKDDQIEKARKKPQEDKTYKKEQKVLEEPERQKQKEPEFKALLKSLSLMKLEGQKLEDVAYFMLEAYRVYLGTLQEDKPSKQGKKGALPKSGSAETTAPHGIGDVLPEQITKLVDRDSDIVKGIEAIRRAFKKGDKILPSPDGEGTAETIAAYGFINLPAELIAALTASEGGDLLWLGSVASGHKDFMHFQLKKKPKLPGERTVSPAENKEKTATPPESEVVEKERVE